MSTDRELLEMAAKAAGIAVIRSRLNDPIHHGLLINNSERNPHQAAGPWNPFENDGDALRLAVRLRIYVIFHHPDSDPAVSAMAGIHECSESIEPDSYVSTRRAIVRAAAELGKAMP